MTVGTETVVKCPCCGRFVAKIAGSQANVNVNCRSCGAELQITYDAGAAAVSAVGKSNEHTKLKR